MIKRFIGMTKCNRKFVSCGIGGCKFPATTLVMWYGETKKEGIPYCFQDAIWEMEYNGALKIIKL
jgi:hypothetical protein